MYFRLSLGWPLFTGLTVYKNPTKKMLVQIRSLSLRERQRERERERENNNLKGWICLGKL